METDDSQDSRQREVTIFCSTLPLPPAHEHSDIYLQFCMWDDYHIIFSLAPLVFSIAIAPDCYSMRFTTLSNNHLIDWCDASFFCFFTWWLDSRFFVTAIWDWKPVDSNSHRLLPLYYKRTDWPSALVTPNQVC